MSEELTLSMDIDSLRLKFSKIYPEIHMGYVLSYSLFLKPFLTNISLRNQGSSTVYY